MMEESLILSQSEYEHLLEEIHKLQARITELTALRDDLVYHVCPALRAEYDEKIVFLERELLEKLKVRLRLLEQEIDHIKTEFPYTLKTFLEDPVVLEEVRRGIQSKIDNVREMNRQLEAFINELKEKLRKGERL